jgi:hypothetical protein
MDRLRQPQDSNIERRVSGGDFDHTSFAYGSVSVSVSKSTLAHAAIDPQAVVDQARIASI